MSDNAMMQLSEVLAIRFRDPRSKIVACARVVENCAIVVAQHLPERDCFEQPDMFWHDLSLARAAIWAEEAFRIATEEFGRE